MLKKTLVVVDMQPCFEASNDPNTIIAVTNEIMVAKQNNDAIIMVEYDSSGRSHCGFDAILKDYYYKSKITKKNDDGSKEIIRALKRRKFPARILRVCGVNTDCCVFDTVLGLLNGLKNTKIELVKKACNTDDSSFSWKNSPFNHLEFDSNFKIV